MFSFDPVEHRDTYRERGWVHVPGGITAEFHAALRDFVRRFAEHRVEGRSIERRKKDQALYEFPPEVDFPGEIFDVVAATCGLDRATMTLSERHIKAYTPDTDPEPPAHKDRFASQVSVGLSIDIPAESRLVLYPFEHLEVNPYNVSAEFRDSLPPERQPEVLLEDAREVEIDDSPRDVVLFGGSAIWHLRRNGAGAVNLYLKMNDFGCDPLGEDPTTGERRQRTLAALGDGRSLDELVPVLGRRVDTFTRRYRRDDWSETVQARVWEQAPRELSESQLSLLRALDGGRTAGALAELLAGEGGGAEGVREDMRALAGAGIVDLVEP